MSSFIMPWKEPMEQRLRKAHRAFEINFSLQLIDRDSGHAATTPPNIQMYDGRTGNFNGVREENIYWHSEFEEQKTFMRLPCMHLASMRQPKYCQHVH